MACQLGIDGTLHAATVYISAVWMCITLCAATHLGFGFGIDGTLRASRALHKLAYPLVFRAAILHVS